MDDHFLQEYLIIVRDLENSPTKAVMTRLFRLVEESYPPAVHTFSVCLERGIGLEKNEQHAFEYCKVAANLGNGAALNNMGCNYVEGRNVPKNPELALRYFSSAAQKGYVGAMHNSAFIVDQGIGVDADGDTALKRYMWAFQNGHTSSANNIGVYYICGVHVNSNPKLAREWFEKGAGCGDAHSVKNLEKMTSLQVGTQSSGFSDFRKYAKIWLQNGIF